MIFSFGYNYKQDYYSNSSPEIAKQKRMISLLPPPFEDKLRLKTFSTYSKFANAYITSFE